MRVRAAVAILGALASCGSGSQSSPTTTAVAIQSERCLVRIHGKSESGSPSIALDDYAELSPSGNEASDGGRQWTYFPRAKYEQARAVVATAIDDAGCEAVVLNGFSNGAAFVGSMYCNGETFAGRLVGVVIDDPVPDAGTLDCRPGEDIEVALYWTGALTDGEPGAACSDIGWICEGGRVVGIEGYADALGVAVQPSPHQTHTWHRDAPELDAWLTSG